jgi:hypothetical protein
MVRGWVLSQTVTVKLHWLLLPAASQAVHRTRVTPVEKVEPLGGTQVTGAFVSQLSAAVTV